MTKSNDIWMEHQRKRFMRPDAYRYIRPDAVANGQEESTRFDKRVCRCRHRLRCQKMRFAKRNG